MSGGKRAGMMLLMIVVGLLALAGLLWFGFSRSSDKVDSYYPTLADARADRVFERGWLPDVMPASARSIKVSNNVDLNLAFGAFEMNPGDADAFFSRLDAQAPDGSPFERWPDVLKDYARRQYTAHYVEHDGYLWAFFCAESEDRCEYLMWNTRSALEQLRVNRVEGK